MKTLKFFLSLLIAFAFSVGTWAATYQLVTSTSDLVAGAHYVIGANNNGTYYFVSKVSNANNRKLTTATVTDGKVTATTDMMSFVLGGNSTSGWTFGTDNYAGTAGYLNATNTTSNNYLKVISALDEYAYFDVDISSTTTTITCKGKSSRNIMYLYSTSQISCYTENTGATYFKPNLYKELPDDGTPSLTGAPASINFGAVLEGTIGSDDTENLLHDFTLTGANLTGNVAMSVVTNGGGSIFFLNGYRSSVTVEPSNGDIDFTVYAIATTSFVGSYTGTLTISSQAVTPDFEDIEIPLSINVVEPITSYNIDFETPLVAYTNWNFSNIAIVSTAITAHGGTYYGNTDGKATASITTKEKILLPGTLTFYISKESTNTGESYWKAQVSDDGSTWTDVESFDAKEMNKGVWNECVANLSAYSNVYVRISYGSSTAIRAIDDITFTMRDPASIEIPTISGETPFLHSTTVSMSILTDGADIVYTLNGDDPQGGDNTYSTPFTIDATTTVKARGFKGVELGPIATKVFTKATVLTVAEAIDAIEGGGDLTGKYVEGYIYRVESYSGTYHSLTYWLTADGHKGDSLEVYGGLGLNSTTFSGTGDLNVGDKVIVCGTLKKFNDIYEFERNNYLVERVAKGAVTAVAITGTASHGSYDAGDAFDPIGLKVTATYASGYQEDATASATWSLETITTAGATDVTATVDGVTSAPKSVNIVINTYTVNFNTSVYGGTFEVRKGGTPISNGNKSVKGAQLEVVATPVAGYKDAVIKVIMTGVETDVTSEVLSGTTITMPTYNITISVEFPVKQEGVLVLNPNSLDWGTITAGTSPLSVSPKYFTLAGSNLTDDRAVTISAPDWCSVSMTSKAPSSGSIATTNVAVTIKDATLETVGNYSGNIRISSEDLTADSLIAVSLIVEGAVPTISVKKAADASDITSIDFGNVDKGANVNQFSISLVGHNLTGDVKVTVTNATSTEVFVTNGFRPSNTYYQNAGEIDAQVIVIPKTSTGGEFSGTITFHSLTGDFDDIVIPLHINIKPDAGLAWSSSTGTAYTKAKPYTLPTLTNPHGVTVTYSGDNNDVATIDASTGAVTLVAAGDVTITASFAGNDDYVAQTVDYALTVKAPTGLRLSGDMATKEYEEGDHVSVEGYTVEAVFGSPYDYYDVTSEASWKLDGVDIATKTVTATAEYTIAAYWEGFEAWEYVNLVRKTHAVTFNSPEHGNLTVKVSGSTFLSGAKFKKGTEVVITISPDAGYKGSVTVNGQPLVGNSYTIGTEDVNIVATFTEKAAAGLAWSATSADAHFGSSNEFPTLTNPNGVEVTYESTNESVATINAAGEITLVAVGTTTIKAIFAGNEDYLEQTASYTLNVSEVLPTPTHTYTVAGTEMLLGDTWCPSCEAHDMTYDSSDGLMKLTVTDVELPIGYYDFKVAIDHRWNNGEAANNSSVEITKDGKYDITFIYDFVNAVTSYELELKEELVITPEISIQGRFGGEMILADDQLTASHSCLIPAGEWSFKVVVNNGYRGRNVNVTRSNNRVENLIEDTDYITLVADVAGVYTYTWTLATNTLVVTFPANNPTGCENIESDETAVKVMIDSHIYIIRGGKTYTAEGQLVR